MDRTAVTPANFGIVVAGLGSSRFITAGGEITIADATDPDSSRVFSDSVPDGFHAIAASVSADLSSVVIGGTDGTILLYSQNDGILTFVREFKVPVRITSLALAERILAIGSLDGDSIRILNLDSAESTIHSSALLSSYASSISLLLFLFLQI